MAYVNVKDWSVDQVTDWLKGLDNVILPYIKSFLNNGVNGHQLLNLRADDLEHLGVKILGHQEIILEAVEHLRNFHFELDKENLQMLALRLSCAANSLYKELLLVPDDSTVVPTQTMSAVHFIMTTTKPLACWLERSPFAGDKDYIENKSNILQLSLEMSTTAHRDIFGQCPIVTLREHCKSLARIADTIIQEFKDPMILQPASLDLATFKKKEQELGFDLLFSYQSVHQITDIKYGSPAHGCTKIDNGDEIVQVNYQTVVGWQRKKVMMLLQELPPEIVLTLKKRPRHTKIYGQIYMKPYRLPSKKRGGENWSRWNTDLPSPRLIPIHDLPPIPIPKAKPVIEPVDVETEMSSSDSEPPDSPTDESVRMYPLKPRPILQRRNTITGATPTSKRPYPSIEQYWEFFKNKAASTHSSSYNIDSSKFEEDSQFLRDKSASCAVGLDLSPRPTTVIGLSQNRNNIRTPSFKKDFKDKSTKSSTKKRVNFEDKNEIPVDKKIEAKEFLTVNVETNNISSNLDEEKSVSINSLASLTNENISFIDEGRDLTDRTSMTSGWKKEIVEEIIDSIKLKTKDELMENEKHVINTTPKDPILTEINVHQIIKKFDEQKKESPPKQIPPKPKILPRLQTKKPPEVPLKPDARPKPAVPPRSATTKLRGRLDKSHSTPAYDLSGEENSPIEKFVVEKTHIEVKQKLPDVIPDLPETPKEPDQVPFNESIYGLGIPVVETTNIPLVHEITKTEEVTVIVQEIAKTEEVKLVEPENVKTEIVIVTSDEPNEDLPPKPPPRTFGIVDIPKPAYPADSPKPPNLVELTKNNQTPRYDVSLTKPVFEFPELPKTDHHTIEPVSPQTNRVVESLPQKVIIEEKPPPKFFEPKMVSTPVTKTRMDFSEADIAPYKTTPAFEVHKSTSESKISPTNSIVKAMISSKSKTAKKKNSLTAKRRKVTVHDLSPADIQGYLYQRLRGKHNQNVHWEKRWFVLLGNCLYGFKMREDPRAACLIFLSGFTVAVASEVKSRSNAFKVYHTGTVFYFSADDPDTLHSWIELIKTATLYNETGRNAPEINLYSETDESDTEKPKLQPSEKSDSLRKFGSLKKFTSKKTETPPSGSTSLDRKWFFNKSSSNPKNSVPVPTSQFRSYRKIKTTEIHTSVTTGNFTSHVPLFVPQNLTQSQNVSVPNLTVDHIPPKESTKSASNSKPKPLNYIHASNPSLCNVSEFNVSSFNKKAYKPAHENLSGLVTLEELMIRQTEERRLNPHAMLEENQINLSLIKPDVVYGELPIRPSQSNMSDSLESLTYSSKKTHSRQNSGSQKSSDKSDGGSSCFGKRLGSLKKHQKEEEFEKTATYPKTTKVFEHKSNRSLPRMHKLQENYKYEHYSSSQYASDRNIPSKYTEQYEMIYCPETVNDVQFAQNRTLDDRMYQDTPKKSNKLKKQHSFSSTDKKSSKSDSLKYSSKIVDSSSSKVKLKSAIQYTPMSLPLTQDPKSKPKFAFELNLDEKSGKSGKHKKALFGKQSDSKKEKTFLGSPKLHRAIFRKHDSGSDLSWPSSASPPHMSMSQSSYSLENSPPLSAEPISMNISPHADYPGLEYPPVFEPETYSLADPQSSLTILRKQTKNTP